MIINPFIFLFNDSRHLCCFYFIYNEIQYFYSPIFTFDYFRDLLLVDHIYL